MAVKEHANEAFHCAEDLGFEVTYVSGYQLLIRTSANNSVTYWTKKKWSSGKDIKDGRGFRHLLNELKRLKTNGCR